MGGRALKYLGYILFFLALVFVILVLVLFSYGTYHDRAVHDHYRWGYVNTFGDLVIPHLYSSAEKFSNGVAAVTKFNNAKPEAYHIDKAGAKSYASSFYSVKSFTEGQAVACSGEFKCGYIDSAGGWLIPDLFSNACPFQNGYAKVDADISWSTTTKRKHSANPGLINKKGEYVIYPAGEKAREKKQKYFIGTSWYYCDITDPQFIPVQDGEGKLFYANTHGEVTLTLPQDADDYTSFYEGFAAFHSNTENAYGMINTRGEEVLPRIATYVPRFQEKMAVGQMYKDGSKRDLYFDQNFNSVLDDGYDEAGLFSEGKAAVKKNGKYGYIDQKGQLVIDYQYFYAGEFHEGMAAVCVEQEKCGYINETGRMLIAPVYAEAQDFSEGMAAVRRDVRELGKGK